MLRPRIIPCLLLRGKNLVKTINFKNPKYIGEPINAVKIFNEYEADEIIFLDVRASKKKKNPNINLIKKIASQCFMPLTYGGGVNNIDTMREVFNCGVEKIILNSACYENTELIKKASRLFGKQSLVCSVDYKKNFFGKKKVYFHSKKRYINKSPLEYSIEMEKIGFGEIMLHNIDNEGTFNGLDFNLNKKVSQELDIPVIACGGANSLNDCKKIINGTSVSGVACGSMVVYSGPERSVLINFPTKQDRIIIKSK